MTDREAVRLALYDAIEWQRGLVHAYAHVPESPERADALQMIRKYRAVLRNRYGTDKHAGQEKLKRLPSVDIFSLLKGARK